MPIRRFAAAVLLAALSTALAAGAAIAGEQAAIVLSQASASAAEERKIAEADVEIRVANDELAQARRRLEAGTQATAKDRINQLRGGGPYTDAYHLRVKALREDVTKAQVRLDHAITARKALGN